MENNERIDRLVEKLDLLLKRQDNFSQEINDLRQEIYQLKTSQPKKEFDIKKHDPIPDKPKVNTDLDNSKEIKTSSFPAYQENIFAKQPNYSQAKSYATPKIKSDIENFIGENLINKIGIAITVIGVAIGAKYSIEHDLISPLTRIILGYLMGLVLLGFGIKLKLKYENYSAVLVSGAIAILYFITYAAYSFYDLIPQLFAFILMASFTAFIVVAAINYNNQIIAHIGLVGAYAVPFLLSDGSGRVGILFSYISIINIGILIIAFKRYWKPLYYSSFLLTWSIFILWYIQSYHTNDHFGLALTFLSVFFATFYTIILAYKLVQKEKFEKENILFLLSNSFIFYGLGYSILSTNKTGEQLLGLFTLANALVHFGISVLIYRQKLSDRNLFFLVAGLVLVFITIAVPVQLDGNWVTLLWTFEAALLFWIGRTKEVSVYEKLSYVLMFLAFFSLAQDWLVNYNSYYPEHPETRIIPLLNINFLTSLLCIVSFMFINFINSRKKPNSAPFSLNIINSIITFSIPSILLIIVYCTFLFEISTYWEQRFLDSAIVIKKAGQEYPNTYMNYDLERFQMIWMINYSLLFFSVLSYLNIRKFRSQILGLANIGLSTFVVVIFLTQGLYILHELKENFINQTLSEYYYRSIYNIAIRYLSYAFVALTLWSIYKAQKQEFIKAVSVDLSIAFEFLLYVSILWVTSSELITWMDIMHFSLSSKLGLSIFWGVYALLLIALGIWKKKKHLRIGAIVLFAITLIKLFFYDINHLNTIAKTIVFVSLGLLLLVISFLYNKYKPLLARENEK